MQQNQNVFFFYPEIKEDSNQGRQVIAGVYNPDNNTITIAKSECSPKDMFCKDKGRKIALGRALCTRTIQPKFYKGLGQNRNSEELLPKVYNIENNSKPQQEFIKIAKSL